MPGAAPGPVTAVTPRPKRSVVVFIDRLFLPDPKLRKATFDSLKSLLAQSLGPGDEAMLVAWHKGVRTVRPSRPTTRCWTGSSTPRRRRA